MTNVGSIEISAPSNSHMRAVIRGFAEAGCIPLKAPEDGRLKRNRQLLILKMANYEARIRLSIFKVTGSSRGKPYERRIQITTTYEKGLQRLPDFQDAVLGFDANHNMFVGVDPRRLEHGGATGNASSFFDKEGLDWKHHNEILVRPRLAKLFPDGVEYHAFFKPSCVAEYLLNIPAIHNGNYGANFPLSIPDELNNNPVSLTIPSNVIEGDILILEIPAPILAIRVDANENLVEAYEQSNFNTLRQAKLSPEKLRDIKRRSEANGYIGEEFVLNYERKRLRRAGRDELANNIKWVSQESAGEGYDILSFELNGQERWIEVKSTSGTGYTFEMSLNEWQTAVEAGNKYYIYRVTKVRTEPELRIISDPSELEQRGAISRSPSGWRVTLI